MSIEYELILELQEKVNQTTQIVPEVIKRINLEDDPNKKGRLRREFCTDLFFLWERLDNSAKSLRENDTLPYMFGIPSNEFYSILGEIDCEVFELGEYLMKFVSPNSE